MNDEQETNHAFARSRSNAGLADAIAKADALRRAHYINEEDCWYSCPASGHCCNENVGTKCNCGADAHNAKVDELVQLLITISANCEVRGCALTQSQRSEAERT